jgi:putative transposase
MRRRRTAEEVTRLLREANRDLAKGLTVSDICRKVGIAETTYYRWRQQHDPEQVNADRRCRELELEVDRLKKLVAELLLDKQMLQDIAKKSGEPRPAASCRWLPRGAVRNVTAAGLPSHGSVSLGRAIPPEAPT